MIPAERQNLILEWLAQNGSMTIETLTERLEVSPMTVHRDLDALARDGRVVKVHGGVALAQPAPENRASLCAMCDRPVQQRTAFTIRLENGTVQTACCPHCGLLLLGDQKVASVLATDFLYGRVVNAAQAAYLFESTVAICCMPSVLAFADAEDAKRFQKGFGGRVMSFTEARQTLHEHHGNIHMEHSRR